MGPALALLLFLQDDPAALLEKLKSDDVRERDAAMRKLESLDLAQVERLQTLAGDDLEVKARLKQIRATLTKRAEIAKVFGPTKRVTASFQQRPLGEVLKELKKALDEPIEGEKVDEGKKIDLELKGATLWEALDALALAAGLRYEYDDHVVRFRPGVFAATPVQRVEQFRIGVAELKRMEFRSPGRSGEAGWVTLTAHYQRNLKPAGGGGFNEGIVIDSIVDAAGKDVQVESVDWASGWSSQGHPFSLLQNSFVDPQAGPFTIEGRTHLRFEIKATELRIPIAEGKRKTKLDDIDFELKEVVRLPSKLTLTLEMRSEAGDLRDRLKRDLVRLVDADGKEHKGSYRGGGRSQGQQSDHLEFETGAAAPELLIVPWITEFHVVEIPFRFEGLKFP